MKHVSGLTAAMLIAGIASLGAQAQGQGSKGPEMKMSAVPQTPEWQRLKTLVGNWEGTVEMEGKQVPATVEVRMTGDGSAITHVMDKGGPYEMVTMIHPDGTRPRVGRLTG